jgi:hypothetical protein
MSASLWLRLILFAGLLILAPTPGLAVVRCTEAEPETVTTEVVAAQLVVRSVNRSIEPTSTGDWIGPAPATTHWTARQLLTPRSAPLHILHCVWRE